MDSLALLLLENLSARMRIQPLIVKNAAEASGLENSSRSDFSNIKPKTATGIVPSTKRQKRALSAVGFLRNDAIPPLMSEIQRLRKIRSSARALAQ